MKICMLEVIVDIALALSPYLVPQQNSLKSQLLDSFIFVNLNLLPCVALAACSFRLAIDTYLPPFEYALDSDALGNRLLAHQSRLSMSFGIACLYANSYEGCYPTFNVRGFSVKGHLLRFATKLSRACLPLRFMKISIIHQFHHVRLGHLCSWTLFDSWHAQSSS
jgi:hypothetical protein